MLLQCENSDAGGWSKTDLQLTVALYKLAIYKHVD